MNMIFLCITFMIVNVIKLVLTDDYNKIIDYFNSDTFQTIQIHWQTERKAFENALALILQENYGSAGMNVYVRVMPDPYKISNGFYFTDNIVDLVLLETRLKELPILIAPEVTFALASNYLHIESRLGRMILDTQYLLMRNQSEVVFTESEQDAYKKSPFSFQQVQDSGELTITVQDCNLVGYTITTLSGNTVNLGLDTFKVTDCKFSLEIYSAGSGLPPVFSSYFSEQQSAVLGRMLSNPIRGELMPKLQAAVFTYINTSAIFGDKLAQLRYQQNFIFKETSNYINEYIGNFIKNTIKNKQGILQLEGMKVSWNRTCSDGTCGSSVELNDVILYGLDTAYSAHIGGPYKLQSTIVAEIIRFSTMQVRGKLYFENETINGEHDFAVELRDVAVKVEMEVKSSSLALISTKVHFVGWRTFEFSILEMNMLAYERRIAQSFISGYLVNEIPKRLLDYVTETSIDLKYSNKTLMDKADSDKDVNSSQYQETNIYQQKENIDNEGEIRLVQKDTDHESGAEPAAVSVPGEKSSREAGSEGVAQRLSNPSSDNEIKK